MVALTTCNKRVFFSRRKSALHEAQLNFRLLDPLALAACLPRRSWDGTMASPRRS